MTTDSKPTPTNDALMQAVKSGDASAALMAVSTPATAADTMSSAIYICIVTEFETQGLNPISNESARIVWIDIPDPVLLKLGNGITSCLAAKNIQVPALAVAFQDLKDSNQVTVVSDLMLVIAQLAG